NTCLACRAALAESLLGSSKPAPPSDPNTPVPHSAATTTKMPAPASTQRRPRNINLPSDSNITPLPHAKVGPRPSSLADPASERRWPGRMLPAVVLRALVGPSTPPAQPHGSGGRRRAGLDPVVALVDSPQLRDNVSIQGVTGQLDHFLSEGMCDTRQPQRDRHPGSSAQTLVRLRLGDEPLGGDPHHGGGCGLCGWRLAFGPWTDGVPSVPGCRAWTPWWQTGWWGWGGDRKGG